MLELKLPSDEEAITLPRFAFSVFRSWCGLMTGGTIAIAFAIWALFGSLPAILFGLVGIVAVFVACYMLWRDERLKRFARERELGVEREKIYSNQLTLDRMARELIEEKQKYTPYLEARVIERYIGQTIIDGVTFSAVTLQIVVNNSGAPSVATDWWCSVSVNGQQPITFSCGHFTEELTLEYSGKKANVISSKDMIYEKTAIPIQTGGRAVGFLHFRTSLGREVLDAEDTVIKVHFKDVKRDYEIICERGTEIAEPGYMPGVDTKIISL
jgi:hypothetical protein